MKPWLYNPGYVVPSYMIPSYIITSSTTTGLYNIVSLYLVI